MANPDHLAILKQGVEAWNAWRMRNPDVSADLSQADLTVTNLHMVDFRRTNLNCADLRRTILHNADFVMANLVKANLWEADLTDADFSGADLRGALLTDTRLYGVNFNGANLSGVDLCLAYLSETHFGKADLCGADLSLANLSETDLSRVNLAEANLGNADLSRANLNAADLRRTNLLEADLSAANLSGARLCGATLRDADLRYAQLSRCDLTRATLTGVQLYGTARDDWIIENVTCRYVFWNAKGTIRSPKDGDFAPAEFEHLCRSLPTIEYVFQDGMTPLDPLIMDRVVQTIREQNPEYDIKIDAINARGATPSIRFTVKQNKQKEPALAQVTRTYEAKVLELAGRLDEARSFIQLLIDRPNSVHIENATAQHLAITGSTISIDQHVENITNLLDTVAALTEDSETFGKVAKKTALSIIGDAMKDVAKGRVKEAAKQIYELGKDLGPVVANTAAYAFFRNCIGQ